MEITLRIKWGTSRGRDTYGYTLCSLYVDGVKKASCNGGGYDMAGTVLGTYVAGAFAKELIALEMPKYSINGGTRRGFYGLSFHDPNYDPGKHVPRDGGGKTVEQRERDGESLGLERYQAFYSASSPVPTTTHRIPLIDGACGWSSVEKIIRALGYELHRIDLRKKSEDVYALRPAA